MAHMRFPEGIPGILGPMAFRPETAKPLNELAEVLLRAPNSLPQADREMIATKSRETVLSIGQRTRATTPFFRG